MLCQKGRFVADSGNPNENNPSTDTGVNDAVSTPHGDASASYDASAITVLEEPGRGPQATRYVYRLDR